MSITRETYDSFLTLNSFAEAKLAFGSTISIGATVFVAQNLISDNSAAPHAYIIVFMFAVSTMLYIRPMLPFLERVFREKNEQTFEGNILFFRDVAKSKLESYIENLKKLKKDFDEIDQSYAEQNHAYSRIILRKFAYFEAGLLVKSIASVYWLGYYLIFRQV